MPIAREMADALEREEYLDMVNDLERQMPRYKIAAAIGVTHGTLYKRIAGAVPLTLEALHAMRHVHSCFEPFQKRRA